MNNKDKIIKFISNPFNIVFIVVQVFVIVFLITFIININSGKENSVVSNESGEVIKNETDNAPEVKVPQLKDLNLPQNSITNIQRALFSIMSDNSTSVSTSDLKTTIRAKKTKFFEKQKINYQTFIIDIEDYRQSYRITHEWSEEEDNEFLAPNDAVTASCVYEKDKTKYTSFQCKDGLPMDPKFSIIRHYANYVDLGSFYVFEVENKPTSIGIEMYASEQSEEEAKTKIESWIKSMGFSPEGFNYDFFYGESWKEDE